MFATTALFQILRSPIPLGLMHGGLAVAVLLQAGNARALHWEWRFETPKDPLYGTVLAEGLLRTADSPDSNGFFSIFEATGQRNGVAISALLPPGSSIPGNAGFTSDNLVRPGSLPLTSNGFNVSFVDGSYSNFFTATYLDPVVDFNFHSVPPSFTFGPETERNGSFQLRLVPVPGPLPLAGAGLALAWSRRLRHSQRRHRR
ncbi:MAG: hypothetical protein ACKO6F_10175 [Cyanobium sp.]